LFTFIKIPFLYATPDAFHKQLIKPMKAGVSNQELWARAKQKPIEFEVRQRKWEWLGHTLRRPPGDIAKAALEWNLQGTRSRGRPRKTWRRIILEEIRHQGKTWNEVKVLARNSVRWRNFVRALCSREE
jgi:hypothetical protein